jgi:hypothetical protein
LPKIGPKRKMILTKAVSGIFYRENTLTAFLVPFGKSSREKFRSELFPKLTKDY